MFGFGIDVPYTKGTQQVLGHPVANNSGICGDSFALQQMLMDLGFYSGGIDGQIGNNTLKSVRLFADAFAVPYAGSFPQAPVCQALMDAWTAKMGMSTPPAPTGTVPTGKLTFVAAKPRIRLTAKGASAVGPSGSSGAMTSVGSWWSSLSTPMKVGVVTGGFVIVGGIVWITMGKTMATPNRRRRRRMRRRGRR